MKYENIIFDLGGVIINLDPAQSAGQFKQLVKNLDLETFNGKLNQLPFYSEFETGKLGAGQMLAKFNEHHQSDLDHLTFSTAWNSMILDFPKQKIELIKKLRAQGKRVFLLSNINEIHEKFVDQRFAEISPNENFRDLFNHAYYSHKLGLRKPNPEIFEQVVKEQKLDKALTVFIDDSFQHIQTAKNLGIDSIHLPTNASLLDLDLFKGIV